MKFVNPASRGLHGGSAGGSRVSPARRLARRLRVISNGDAIDALDRLNARRSFDKTRARKCERQIIPRPMQTVDPAASMGRMPIVRSRVQCDYGPIMTRPSRD